MRRTVIFDLDGTLVDSRPDIAAALNRLMESRGEAPFNLDEVTGFIGDGVPALLHRAFMARGSLPDKKALADFLDDYEVRAAVHTRPFPGVPALLDRLRQEGWGMAVCTNKPERAARLLLEGLELEGYFAALGGGDTLPVRKPDPHHVLWTLAAAGGDPARAVMVGDHHNDVAAGRAAGLPAIFCAWGYGSLSMAADAPLARTPAELGQLLEAALVGADSTANK